MQEKMDYILGTDRRRFKMVRIRSVSNYPLYLFFLQARLLIFPTESGHHCNSGGLPAKMGNLYRGSEGTGR